MSKFNCGLLKGIESHRLHTLACSHDHPKLSIGCDRITYWLLWAPNSSLSDMILLGAREDAFSPMRLSEKFGVGIATIYRVLMDHPYTATS